MAFISCIGNSFHTLFRNHNYSLVLNIETKLVLEQDMLVLFVAFCVDLVTLLEKLTATDLKKHQV